jgi:hypothetical protein
VERTRRRAPSSSWVSTAGAPTKRDDRLTEYGGYGQKDFLSMSGEEWRKFIGALWEARRSGRLSENSLLEFLHSRGLYAQVNIKEMRGLSRAKKWRLAAAMLREAGFEPVAALQWPFLLDGEVEAWPPSEEARLLKVFDESDLFDELLLRLLHAYGPCVAVDFEDGLDSGVVLARPKPSQA